jgi:hypothetical protein
MLITMFTNNPTMESTTSQLNPLQSFIPYFPIVHFNIVADMLKARTVEPDKLPLLANGSQPTFVSWQRLGKHIRVATDTHATTEVLLATKLSTRAVQTGCKEASQFCTGV